MATDFSAIITGISTAGIFTGIISLIFFICFFILYIQFLTRGLEILILRVGVPLACVGLMDNDNGVFRTYNDVVVKKNPDIILSPIWLDAELGGWKGITPLREIYTRSGYDETNAVTRSRVLYYDSALMKHFGPRQVVATQKLAYLLHPEHFESPEGTIPWELGWIK